MFYFSNVYYYYIIIWSSRAYLDQVPGLYVPNLHLSLLTASDTQLLTDGHGPHRRLVFERPLAFSRLHVPY